MKLVAALFALMLAIAAAAGLVFLRSAPGDCEDRGIEEARAPDGRVGAQVYERRCGSERTTRVRLFLVGNPRTPADVWAAEGAASPHVRFSGTRAVVIDAPSGSRLLLREGSWRDVTIASPAR